MLLKFLFSAPLNESTNVSHDSNQRPVHREWGPKRKYFVVPSVDIEE